VLGHFLREGLAEGVGEAAFRIGSH
jgi:hypothetical protein